MKLAHSVSACDLDGLRHLAERLVFILTIGDTVVLNGDLGAGKTTFARALIRAAAGRDALEIPSPTFNLVQTYETPRFELTHFDLYRMTDPDELDELGLDAALSRGIAIVEWPERAGERLATPAFSVTLTDASSAETRNVTIAADGVASSARLERLVEIELFLQAAGWNDTAIRTITLQGDASPRRYARLRNSAGATALLMDAPRQPDGPPIAAGLPYSRIAHLAEDVRAFAAVALALEQAGVSTPRLIAHDFDAGLLLTEDFGDRVFGQEVRRGCDQHALWRRATDTLAALSSIKAPALIALPDGRDYALPELDRPMLAIEAGLFLDWYWPYQTGVAALPDVADDFRVLWDRVFDRILALPRGWMLRDYHSPNLIDLPDRSPPRDVGLIDFQDAVSGPAAYDLVSLLQDARLDVAPEIETALQARYLLRAGEHGLSIDPLAFRFAYAALGAQRNTKILGIFARLAKRDRKPHYLAHVPRIWGYLDRCLAHEELAPLKAWYDRHLPAASRHRRPGGR